MGRLRYIRLTRRQRVRVWAVVVLITVTGLLTAILLHLRPMLVKLATARCSNTEKGPVARKVCELSCIACGACERACPADAIHVVDNHAVIDYSACIACGMCATKCPRGVIRDAWGIVAQS